MQLLVHNRSDSTKMHGATIRFIFNVQVSSFCRIFCVKFCRSLLFALSACPTHLVLIYLMSIIIDPMPRFCVIYSDMLFPVGEVILLRRPPPLPPAPYQKTQNYFLFITYTTTIWRLPPS